jgi:hypothetical protein
VAGWAGPLISKPHLNSSTELAVGLYLHGDILGCLWNGEKIVRRASRLSRLTGSGPQFILVPPLNSSLRKVISQVFLGATETVCSCGRHLWLTVASESVFVIVIDRNMSHCDSIRCADENLGHRFLCSGTEPWGSQVNEGGSTSRSSLRTVHFEFRSSVKKDQPSVKGFN